MITPELIMEYGFQIAFAVYLVYLSENHLKGIKEILLRIEEKL